jgi:hypothetical protein
MNKTEKQQIADRLAEYCARYESQNKAANSLKGVSAATISQMLNHNWELIKEEMWRNVSAQIGYSTDEWIIAETRDFKLLTKLLLDAKEDHGVSFIIGKEGSGKTETIKSFVEDHKHVFVLKCNDFWNRKTFLAELLAVMGRDSSGLTMYGMMALIIKTIKALDHPEIVLDEFDKLSDQILYFFITLFNNLEDRCAITTISTHYLKKRIENGITSGKKGFPEIYSRGGKKFIELKGVGSMDVRAVCMANGITSAVTIKEIYEDSENDLRRVKKKIRAYKKHVQPKQETAA